MSLNFIFNHVYTIALAVWAGLFVLVAVRFVRPQWVKNISYGWLVVGMIFAHLFYGAFVTWGQYHVWATSSDYTMMLISAPLPAEAPLPSILEWSRPYFAGPLGYFAYYAFGRIWLKIIEVFVVAGFFYAIFKTWSFYRGGFLPQGPEILLALLLISGWSGILVLVPLGFALVFIFFGASLLKNKTREIKPVHIEPSFLVATPVALVFGDMVINKLFHIL